MKEALKKLDNFAFLAVEEPKFKEESPTTLHLPKKADESTIQSNIPMLKAPDGQRQVAVK